MTRWSVVAIGHLIVASSLAAQSPNRAVAITIDDLPVGGATDPSRWAAVTRSLLDVLTARRVPAVGFVNEGKLYLDRELDSARVGLLRAWLAAGQELGNHTFAHRSAHHTPLTEYADQILRGERVTRRLAAEAGRPFRYFRHPQLHAGRTLEYRQGVERFLGAHGYVVAPVTVDNSEWIYAAAYARAREQDDAALAERVLADYLGHLDTVFAYSERLSRELFGREIPLVLLLHANEINAAHLGTLLDRIAARGYRFVPLAQVLGDSAYQSRDTYVGPIGPSWLVRWAESRGLTPPPEPQAERYVIDASAIPGR